MLMYIPLAKEGVILQFQKLYIESLFLVLYLFININFFPVTFSSKFLISFVSSVIDPFLNQYLELYLHFILDNF